MGRSARLAVLVAPVVVCLFSCAPQAADPKPKDVDLDPTRKADRHGERLPAGAVARLGTLKDRPGAGSRGLSFSPDGALLAFVAQDGDTRIWDVKTETELHRFMHDPVHFPTGHDRRVFATDGKLLIGDGGAVWEVPSAKPEGVVTTGEPADRFGPVPKAGDWPLAYPTVSPDGKTVLFVTHTGGYEACEVVVFDVATRKELRRFGRGTRVDGPLVFSPDGKTLAAPRAPEILREPLGRQKRKPREPNADNTSGMLLWDWATGEKKAEWPSKFFGPWTPLGFSDDAKALYVLDGEKLVVWEVATGKPAREPFGHWMRRAVLLPDRKTLAVTEPRGLALWSIADEKQIGKVERPVAWTLDMVPSPSGRWLATSGNDGTILVWDVAALRAKP